MAMSSRLAFEPARDAAERAAGADRARRSRRPCRPCRPRFPRPWSSMWMSRLAVLSNWLAQIAPLGSRRGERFGQARGVLHVVVGIAVGHRRHLDHLGAEHAQRVLLLLALGVGNDDHGAQAERVAEHGEADAGVAGGALDDRAARPQPPARHRVRDDAERGAILDRRAGVHELGLAEDRAAGFLGGAAKLDQRRVADGGGDA